VPTKLLPPANFSTNCTKGCSTFFFPFPPPLSGRRAMVIYGCHRWPACRSRGFWPTLHRAAAFASPPLSGAGHRGPKFGPLFRLVVSYEPSTSPVSNLSPTP
jgi:hypothetical protein